MTLYEKTAELLAHCGFKPNESRVYLAMLQSGHTSPAKIARYCELPRQKIYRVLDDLVTRGACTVSADPRRQYQPMDPGVIISRARHRLDELQNTADEVGTELEKLFEKRKNTDAYDNFRVLVDPLRINEFITEMIGKVEFEALTFSTSSKLVPELRKLGGAKMSEIIKNYQKNIDESIRVKGVKHLNITSRQNINKDAIIFKHFINYDYDNHQVRISDDVRCRLMIFDRETIVTGVRNDLSDQYILKTLIIRDKALAALLAKGFYAVYEEADSIEEAGIEDVLEECRMDYEKWKANQEAERV